MTARRVFLTVCWVTPCLVTLGLVTLGFVTPPGGAGQSVPGHIRGTTGARPVFIDVCPDTMLMDADAIEASNNDGVLEIRIPVREEAKPRKIEVGTTKELAS